MATEIEKATIALGDTTKKPGSAKSSKVIAVQQVDKSGKVMEGDGAKQGAAATEKERESEDREKRSTKALEQLVVAERDSKGRFVKRDVETGTAMSKLAKAFVGGALLLLIPAVIGFLNSKAWTNIKDFFVNKFIPWMKMLWTDFGLPIWGFLKSVGKEFFDKMLATWENIKTMFSGVTKGFEDLFDGEIIKGLKGIFGHIGSFVLETLDLGLTFIFNTIAKIFGLEQTDSVFGSIKKAFTDIKNSILNTIKGVKEWFGKIFSWAKDTAVVGWTNLKTYVVDQWGKVKTWFTKLFTWADTEDAKDSWVIKTVKGVVTGVKAWFKKLFKFDGTENAIASVINLLTWFPNLVKDGVLAVGTWLAGLFGFDEAAKKMANAKNWTIGGLAVDALKGIKNFLWKGDGSGALEFNMDTVKDILPKWMKNPKEFFGGMVDKMTEFLPDWMKKAIGVKPPKTEEEKKEQAEKVKKLKEDLALAQAEHQSFKELRQEERAARRELMKQGTHMRTRYQGVRGMKKEGQLKKEVDRIKELIEDAETKATGGRYGAGQPFFAGEGGQLELIIPDRAGMVMSAAKTQQLMQENIRRTVDGMGIGAPAAPTVITNAGGNVTNAPTTNYIQQGISVRRPIILNAPTTTMG